MALEPQRCRGPPPRPSPPARNPASQQPAITTRDLVIVGYGDLVAPDTVMCYLASLHDGRPWSGEGEPPEGPAPAGAHSYSEHTLPADTKSAEAGNIRLRVVGGFLFTALDPRRTAVSCFLKLDVVHPLVPPMLIDVFMKNFASMFLILLDKQATKHDAGGSLHHMLSAPENAPVYAELHRRLSRATGTSSQDSKEVARQLSAELTAARESQQLGTAKRR